MGGAPRVTVSVLSEGSWAVLRVEDDGPGVSADDLGRIFDPLYRADASRSRAAGAEEGSGIGLSFVRRAAERMGGAASADAVSPHGLAIELRFPLADSEGTGGWPGAADAEEKVSSTR